MAVSSWSTTAGLNVLSSGIAGTGGTNIDEGCAPSGINNAIRDIMSQIATLVTDSNFTLTSTDAGATANPTLTLYRNSASPAASDIIGKVLFQGEDSAGNTEDYAEIYTSIADPTSTSEDASILLRAKIAGTMTTMLTLASTGSTIPGMSHTFTATGDDTAEFGPLFIYDRVSASPAASDGLARIQLRGRTSTGATANYIDIQGYIADATNGSTDGRLIFLTAAAGASTTTLTLESGITTAASLVATTADINGGTVDAAAIGATTPSTGVFTGLTVVSTDAGAGVGPNLVIDRQSASPAAADVIGGLYLRGRDSGNNTADYGLIYGTIDDPTNGSEDGVVSIQTLLAGAATDAVHIRGGGTRLYQNTTSTPGAGNNTVGHALGNGGDAYHSCAGAALNVNRTADGNVAGWYSGGTLQGVVSIATTTVTYGTFFGSHWSQLADGSKPDILRGTIVESIDQMCKWPGDVNEHLPCFKISDTAGSRRVYGIFALWDDADGGPTNDAFIGSLGAFMVRIAKGEKVQNGDYIESAGNGCGRVQADDLMRSSTVAKVTSAEVIETYPDGSFLVPCTLHCG